MNSGARIMVHSLKSPLELDKGKMQKQGKRLVDSEKITTNRRCSRRERKMALLEDVVMLKKKLRHEESVHRALERAFTRPLGALPRLPSYLPQYTLELLAEVAVLEEEVVRLEEQVVNFRQGLYEEAVQSATSKRIRENGTDVVENKEETPKSASKGHRRSATMASGCSAQLEQSLGYNRSTRYTNEKQPSKRVHCSEDVQGKENQSCVNSRKNIVQSPKQPEQRIRTSVKGFSKARRSIEKDFDSKKLEGRTVEDNTVEVSSSGGKVSEGEESNANKISEDLLRCLSSIFLRMSRRRKRNSESEMFYSLMQMPSIENSEGTGFRDPYGTCKELGKQDIGAYTNLRVIEANSIDTSRKTNSLFLLQRLKLLLEKLASVKVHGLTHQQKLAFWINIYNSCMMNAFLEYGIPESPQKVVSLLQKAMLNVGGQSLNAMTIEHFILRLPHHSKATSSKCDSHEKKKQSNFGLEWSEPLVTFALSCGSWSSPAVRVYTPSQIENELEKAKKDYLQAAVGVSSSNKLLIPKLLDWYLLDFAKDLESLVDWICLQLPKDLRNHAIRCLERGKREPLSQSVQVMPYEFTFRYLLLE